MQASKDSVAAGGNVGAVVTGDHNILSHIYVLPPNQPGGDTRQEAIPTRLISECRPLDLEVHHAIHVAAETTELPVYVARDHDIHLQRVVAAARAGQSQMCVLVGESSTGKTRACWEAIQVLAADGWHLWHPFDPTRAEAALAGLASTGPRTVVWLNEAQHYLSAPDAGEPVAAALQTLLADASRAPILVVATLWPVHWDQLTRLPTKHEHDAHPQSRYLLTGRQIRVPDAFTEKDLDAVRSAARSDERLAQALEGAADRRITQFLAGVPALLARHRDAGPGARAVLDAAMDARRLGCSTALPAAFLEKAAIGYLSPSVLRTLDDDWFRDALSYSTWCVHGDAALLERIRRFTGSSREERWFRLADYMEQYGRRTRSHLCPPASFWEAALEHLTRPADVSALASAAAERWRLRYARLLRELASRLPRSVPVTGAEEQPSQYGWLDHDAGWPADHLTCRALADLAFNAAESFDYEQAADLALQAGRCCQPDALAAIALRHEAAGLPVEASDLAHYAAINGSPSCLSELAMMREQAGLHDEAAHYAREAAAYGFTGTLADLAIRREAAGDRETAEDLWETAARYGHPEALATIARFQYENHDLEGALDTARQAVDRGEASPFQHRAKPLWVQLWPHGIEPDGSVSLPHAGGDSW
ncbi:hypothetical protein ACFWIJ_40820 [Streptomyces sp. NPDC127079]|uniref:hypothetical protein n=1 Tax=Streptomyces sp. NPDC127079 TaxID=3347132 RepID=UPI00364D2539